MNFHNQQQSSLQFSPGLPPIRKLPNTRIRITIRDLELSAMRCQCYFSCLQVRNTGRTQYLTVTYYRLSQAFTYKWGRVKLDRAGADLLLDEMSADVA